MSNSPLVSFTRISPNSNNPRNARITKITPHHMAGNLSLETLGNIVANPARQMSCNYGIDSAGRVGMYCEEKNRSWCSSSPSNDHQAVTIEVANDEIGGNWHISDQALAKLIDLCVDICQRNGIPQLVYTGDATGNLTHHNMFAATACPGPYLQSKMPHIAQEVNKRLASTTGEPPMPSNPTTGGLLSVQVGAFASKSNAAAWAQKVEAAGFPTYLKTKGGLYKVQVGAFKDEANAKSYAAKVKAAGFDAFIVGGTSAPPATAKPATIGVGSTVRLNRGAKFYDGTTPYDFVYNRNHVVSELLGDRAIITYSGTVVGAVRLSDLVLAQ